MSDELWSKIVYEMCLQRARQAQRKSPSTAPPWSSKDIYNLVPDYRWEQLYRKLDKAIGGFWK